MSSPTLRRADRVMTDEALRQMVEQSFSGRLATVGADGYPYCIPLLYVWMDQCIFVHGTSAHGHLRQNVAHNSNACFELDEPGQVFDYGRFECDSGLAFRSAVLFGQLTVVDDGATKQRFCEALMIKYRKGGPAREPNFFPRLDLITVYRFDIARMTGKEQVLPSVSEQWPAIDRTKTPHARGDTEGPAV